jgi:hypothetical protein
VSGTWGGDGFKLGLTVGNEEFAIVGLVVSMSTRVVLGDRMSINSSPEWC